MAAVAEPCHFRGGASSLGTFEESNPLSLDANSCCRRGRGHLDIPWVGGQVQHDASFRHLRGLSHLQLPRLGGQVPVDAEPCHSKVP